MIRYLRSRTLYLTSVRGDGDQHIAAIAVAHHDFEPGEQTIYDGDTDRAYLINISIAPGTSAYRLPIVLRAKDALVS